MQAWDRSKRPRSRVRQQTGATAADGQAGADGPTVTEVVERDGSVEYIDRALAALAHLRKLWGLDVAEKSQDGPGAFSEVMRRVKANAARFEREAVEGGELDAGA